MEKTSRRQFMQKTAGGVFGTAMLALTGCYSKPPYFQRMPADQETMGEKKLSLGLASYTFRNFNLNETIAMTKRLGLSHICFKSFHLPLESSEDQIKAAVNLVQEAGLDLYAGGVVYMKSEVEVNQAFDYARFAGMRMIIGAPNHDLLGLVNKKVQEYDIQLAIHNHGPGDEIYPSPQSAYEKIRDLDARIGLCIDIGHTTRYGLDPILETEKYADRLLDVHIKDVSAASAEGTTIEMGRGVIDIPGYLRTLLKLKYQGVAAFEFEKDEKDPLPGVAESVGYVRGVLDTL
jgi:inosose dehydratase